MIQAYNFLASWQLFPEKGTYQHGQRPKSGIYKISAGSEKNSLQILLNWVSLENQAFSSQYEILADGLDHPFADPDMADSASVHFIDGINFEIHFQKNSQTFLQIRHELQPNGYLKVLQLGSGTNGEPYQNTEYYHKQLSVLPYSASVSGAVIKANEEGVIRHKALTAMEEQTNMQLEQIRKQIELLALQAQEIQMRKELSMIIYNAKLNFQPVIGHVYYLFEKQDGSHVVTMISPREWGGGAGPYKKFLAQVKLLADHTWVEII
jgi:hypothetical protein